MASKGIVNILIQVKKVGTDALGQLRSGLGALKNDAAVATAGFRSSFGNGFTSVINGVKGAFSSLGTMIKQQVAAAGGLFEILGLAEILREVKKVNDAANDLDASIRRLSGAATLAGAPKEFVTKTAKALGDEFKLTDSFANRLTAETLTLTGKAGDLGKTFKTAGSFLDLAAAQGLNATEALELLQGAADGNTRSLKQLFNTTPDQVFDEFAAKIHKARDRLDEFDRAQAIVNLILEKGGKVVGKYKDFLESAAGAQEVMKNRIQDTEEAIGHRLQPAFLNFLEGISKLTNAVLVFIGIFETLGTTIGTVFDIALDVIKGVAGAGFALAKGVSTAVGDILTGDLDNAKTALGEGFTAAAGIVKDRAKDIRNSVVSAFDEIRGNAKGIGEEIFSPETEAETKTRLDEVKKQIATAAKDLNDLLVTRAAAKKGPPTEENAAAIRTLNEQIAAKRRLLGELNAELVKGSPDDPAVIAANAAIAKDIAAKRKLIADAKAAEDAATEAAKRKKTQEQDDIDALKEANAERRLSFEEISKVFDKEIDLRKRLQDPALNDPKNAHKRLELQKKLNDVLEIENAFREKAEAPEKAAEAARNERLANEIKLIQAKAAANEASAADLERLKQIEADTVKELAASEEFTKKTPERLARELVLRQQLAEVRGAVKTIEDAPVTQQLQLLSARVQAGAQLIDTERQLRGLKAQEQAALAANLTIANRTASVTEKEAAIREKIVAIDALLTEVTDKRNRAVEQELALIQARSSLGALSAADKAELNRLEQETLAALKNQNLTLEQQLKLLTQLGQIRAIRAAKDDVALFKNELQEAVAGPLTDFFKTAITGFKNFGDAIKQFFTAIANALAGLAANLAAKSLLKTIFGVLPGVGGGNIGSVVGAITASGFAEGGVISGPGGPKDDRILVRLSHGEGVLTAKTTRALGGASGIASLNRIGELGSQYAAHLHTSPVPLWKVPRFADGGVVGAAHDVAGGVTAHVGGTISVEVAPELVISHLKTPAGQKVLLQVVRQNRHTFRTALGI